MSWVYVSTINSSHTISVPFLHDLYMVDASSNNIKLKIPDATTIGDGVTFYFQRVDSTNNSVLITDEVNLINDDENYILNPYTGVRISSTGSGWIAYQQTNDSTSPIFKGITTAQGGLIVGNYNTASGIVSQTGNTITSGSNLFNSSMVGGIIIFANESQALITGYTSPLSVSATPSQTITSQTCVIYYNAIQADINGNLGCDRLNVSSLTSNSLMLTDASDNVSSLSLTTDQIPVGAASGPPVATTIQSGGGLSMVNNGTTLTFSLSSNVFANWMVSDIKASGTAGGSSVASTWTTRVLNTISSVGSASDNVTLASNTLTIKPGKYMLLVQAPGFATGNHRIRMRNTTNNSTTFSGSNSSVGTTSITTLSIIQGVLEVTTISNFQIQHWVSASRATNGFGNAVGNGDSEVYTTMTIIQIA